MASIEIAGIDPVGNPPGQVQVSRIYVSDGDFTTAALVAVAKVWVQTGDYPGVENRTRYLLGTSWVPGTKRVRVGNAWVAID